jgi:hypothetical protein
VTQRQQANGRNEPGARRRGAFSAGDYRLGFRLHGGAGRPPPDLAQGPASGGTDTSNTIPVTGQRTGTLVALGAGSFVLGALMVLAAVTRRRRATASVPAE